MQIRAMQLQDCEQVSVIEAAVFSMSWSLRAFQETVSLENYRYFVAEEDGNILGYCGFTYVLDEAEIPNVCVKEEARGQHIGSKLMEKLIEEARKMQIAVLYLEVRKSNLAARKLYQKLGFCEDGLRRDFYEQPKEDAILMSLTL